jgi:hypothetical protein
MKYSAVLKRVIGGDMKIPGAVVSVLVFLAPAFAGPITLVVPNFNTSTPGNTDDDIEAGPLDIRFQQIYGSGQFSGVGGPLLISAFANRAAPGTGAASLSATSVDVYASTTRYFSNNNGGEALFLRDTFATNLGPDNTLVFSGPVDVRSPGCAGPGVCPFDFIFPLSTPFLYDPTQGRLLLDFHIVGLSGSGSFDSVRFTFPPGGSVAGVVGPLGDPTGSVFTDGNITQFTYQVVPEPASGALLLGGLGALVALRRRAIGNKAEKREPVR